MPTNWKKIIDEAGEKTKKEFQSEVSSLTKLTDANVASLLNETGINQEDFAKVVAIVNDATRSNEAKARAIQNIDKGIGLLVNIAKKLL